MITVRKPSKETLSKIRERTVNGNLFSGIFDKIMNLENKTNKK